MADIWLDVDTAVTVFVNKQALIDDTDFKTREESVVYNQAGLDLVWNFETTAGVITQTAVTPTDTAGVYDWTNVGNGMYKIEIPASGGGTINNDTEGFGWFTGFATGILPWCGPVYGFRAAGLNNLLIDDAFSATRGLAGTALPTAAADAAGGLPISDAGGLDMDAQRSDVAAILVDTGTTLQAELDGIQADTEDIQTRLPAALVSGRIDASVGAMAANVMTAAAAAADLTTELQSGLATSAEISALNNLSAAQVNAEVDTALADVNLDHLVGTATAIPAIPAGTFLDQIMDDGTAAFDRTTDSLQAIRDRGDAAWITATGFSTHSAADVWAVATRVLTAGTNLNNLSAAEVLTQVNAAIDTAIAELGVAAPTATPTLRTGLMLLYMALRNKTTSTATETTISNNAGTTIATAAQSDDTVTYEKSEFA